MGLWARLTGQADDSTDDEDRRDVGSTSKVVTNWTPGRDWTPDDGDPRAGSSWDRTRPWEGGR